MTPVSNDSTYRLNRLLQARQWFDAGHYPERERWLEEQIQKRCARFQEPTRRREAAGSGAHTRYTPYGVIFGIFFLAACIGPNLIAELLDTIGLIDGDFTLLWGLWALLTLPVAVMVFIIGGIMDAERVVKWLDL